MPAGVACELGVYPGPFHGADAFAPMTTREIVVHGVAIPEGQYALQALAAANHGEALLLNPERFDIERDASRHVASEHGVRFSAAGLELA